MLAALSRHLEAQDPERALALYPLNTEARVALIGEALNGRREVEDVEGETRRGLALDPVDARFYSILAEFHQRKGEQEKAFALFQTAHRISHTEHHALTNLIRIAVENGDYGDAVRTADVLFRRWPERFNELAPFMASLVAQEDAYRVLVEFSGEGLPWRGRLISFLAVNDDFTPLAHRLLMDLVASENPPSRAEKAALLNGYWRQRAYADAYRLFLMTLSEEDRELTGFVHNSGFSAAQEPQLFAWNYRNTPEADIRFSNAPAPYNGAIVRFLDKPAREVVLRQNLVLPQGRYRLKVDASAFSLRTPRDLFLTLNCVRPNRELARLQLPEGNYRDNTIEFDFEVADCPAQTIRLETGLVAESWRHRYSGQIVLHNVAITRASGDEDRS